MYSKSIDIGLPAGGPASAAAAVWTLIRDALAICQAVEPDLGAVLAHFLELEPEVGEPPRWEGDDDAALATCLRMLVYARAEAQIIAERSTVLPRLELCIGCLSEHVQLAWDSSPEPEEAEALHS
jgi:hypothetical protein